MRTDYTGIDAMVLAYNLARIAGYRVDPDAIRKEMSLVEMERLAVILQKTSWERILEDYEDE